MKAAEALARPVAAKWDTLFKARADAWEEPRALDPSERHLKDLIARLRLRVLAPPALTERMQAVFFDQRRAILGEASLGVGCSNALFFRCRDIFAQALHLGANSMVLAHNHPSGNCRPSRIDIEATARIANVASALDIELIDHLIFTTTAVYSMRGKGEL